MDEIEILRKVKKTSMLINIVIAFFCITIATISFFTFPSENSFVTSMIILIIGMALIIFNLLVYVIIFAIYKLSYSKINLRNPNKEYFRDIYNFYPPAIVSILFNMKTEVYRDYTATILKLHINKYIRIDNFNEDIKIYKSENDNLTQLQQHERYVYDCIINNNKFDEEEFKNFIIQDALDNNLIKKSKRLKIKTIGVIFICLYLLGLFITSFLEGHISIILSIFVISLIIIIGYFREINAKIKEIYFKVNANYKLSNNGKAELKKIKAFKNFIEDYTLIKEKNIEHIEILEEYLPYSLCLGISKEIERYIKENELYRNLIYKNERKQ